MKKVYLETEATLEDVVEELKKRGYVEEILVHTDRYGAVHPLEEMSDTYLIRTAKWMIRKKEDEENTDFLMNEVGIIDPYDCC